MSYSERSFAGPDMRGQTFEADHCAHCATWQEKHPVTGRLAMIARRNTEAARYLRARAA